MWELARDKKPNFDKDVLIAIKGYGITIGRYVNRVKKDGILYSDWWFSDGRNIIGRIENSERVVAWCEIPKCDIKLKEGEDNGK